MNDQPKLKKRAKRSAIRCDWQVTARQTNRHCDNQVYIINLATYGWRNFISDPGTRVGTPIRIWNNINKSLRAED